MKTCAKLLSAAVLALCCTLSARAETEPVQLSLWAPDFQLRPAESSVRGIRLDIYGQNDDITGLDFGFVGIATGDVNGLSYQFLYDRIDGDAFGLVGGLILHVKGEACGLEGGCAAFFEKDFTGLCSGVYSEVQGCMKGVQWGFVNNCHELKGVQFGFVNMARTGRGLQLGLVNIFDEGFSPVFPFFNFHF